MPVESMTLTFRRKPRKRRRRAGDTKIAKDGTKMVCRTVQIKYMGEWVTLGDGRGGARLEWVPEGTPWPAEKERMEQEARRRALESQ